MLIANKIDVAKEERVITTQMGQELANKFGIEFREVSAFEGSNVKESFNELAREILEVYKQIDSQGGNALKTGSKLKDIKNNVKKKLGCSC